jgi:hypothetical protein
VGQIREHPDVVGREARSDITSQEPAKGPMQQVFVEGVWTPSDLKDLLTERRSVTAINRKEKPLFFFFLTLSGIDGVFRIALYTLRKTPSSSGVAGSNARSR